MKIDAALMKSIIEKISEISQYSRLEKRGQAIRLTPIFHSPGVIFRSVFPLAYADEGFIAKMDLSLMGAMAIGHDADRHHALHS